MNKFSILLASSSPRRKQLLEQIGALPVCQPVDIDESKRSGESVEQYCLRMAINKAQEGQLHNLTHLPVLGADTIVVNDGKLLGKPKDAQNAFDILRSLSGKKHQVMSAVCIIYQGKRESVLTTNEVEFTGISDKTILRYIQTGEPMDKAGAYGIQGLGAMWIKNIHGSYSSVMGLPLYETTQLLQKLAIIKAWF